VISDDGIKKAKRAAWLSSADIFYEAENDQQQQLTNLLRTLQAPILLRLQTV